jgi:hypothetical protein
MFHENPPTFAASNNFKWSHSAALDCRCPRGIGVADYRSRRAFRWNRETDVSGRGGELMRRISGSNRTVLPDTYLGDHVGWKFVKLFCLRPSDGTTRILSDVQFA